MRKKEKPLPKLPRMRRYNPPGTGMNQERVYGIPDIYEVISHLEEHGGNLGNFLKDAEPDEKWHAQLLARIRIQLLKTPEAARMWDEWITVGRQVNRDLVEQQLILEALDKKNLNALRFLVDKDEKLTAASKTGQSRNPLLDRINQFDEDGE